MLYLSDRRHEMCDEHAFMPPPPQNSLKIRLRLQVEAVLTGIIMTFSLDAREGFCQKLRGAGVESLPLSRKSAAV